MISLDDYLGVVHWAADTPHAAGPYNLTIPVPTTNAEFTDELARQLHRPRVLKVPAVVLRTALGELSGQLLGDIYAVPERLQAARIPVLLPRRLGDDRRGAPPGAGRLNSPHEPGLHLPRTG